MSCESNLIESIKNTIIEHSNDESFDSWLAFDAINEFGQIYVDEFKSCEQDLHTAEHCSDEFRSIYGPSINEAALLVAGANLLFGINAFLSFQDEPTLDDILRFVEFFIFEQFRGINEWLPVTQI